MDASPSIHPNNQLRQERIRHNWRQQEVADLLGTTIASVKRWERGSHHPSLYYCEKLCALFEKSAEELGLVEGTILPPIPPEKEALGVVRTDFFPLNGPWFWLVPYRRNPFFTGRNDVLQQIHVLLKQAGGIALTQSLALSGLGGIGKTQTALEYVYQYAHEYTAIAWVAAETYETLVTSYRAFAKVLSLPENEDQNQRNVVSAVIQWFTLHRDWLLVLDNVENLPLLKTFLPTAPQGALLITTRLHSVGSLAQSLKMHQMTQEEGSYFLLHRAGLLRSHETLESLPQSTYLVAQEIATALDGLPLALDQAGAYIHKSGCGLTNLLYLFQLSPGRLLDEREEHTHHPLSVVKTFTIIYEKLRQKKPAAVELLQVCSFLAPNAIAERFFTEGAMQLGPGIHTLVSDPWQWNTALEDLLSYSLITRHPETRMLTIHRVVQAVIRDRLSEQTQREWTNRLVGVLNQIFPAESLNMEQWTWCDQLMPHVINVLSTPEQTTDLLVASSLLHKTATYLNHRARYLEAQKYYQRALDLREQVVGGEHQQLVDPLIGLIQTTYFLEKYPATIAYAQQVIGILEQTQGIDAFALIVPLNVLANVYRNRRHFAEAERLLLRSLSIWVTIILQETSGPGQLFSEVPRQRKEEQHAEVLIQQTLSLWEQAPHRHHYQVGQALTALSEVYQQQQRYTEAEAILLPLHQLGKRALGERHYMTTFSLMVLAKVYKGQGRLVEAEQLYQCVLTLREEALGFHHPKTLETRTEYAVLLRTRGKEDEATGD